MTRVKINSTRIEDHGPRHRNFCPGFALREQLGTWLSSRCAFHDSANERNEHAIEQSGTGGPGTLEAVVVAGLR